jgi:hypothetical protein
MGIPTTVPYYEAIMKRLIATSGESPPLAIGAVQAHRPVVPLCDEDEAQDGRAVVRDEE